MNRKPTILEKCEYSQGALPTLKCSILPGRFRYNQTVPELHNTFYSYWKNTWQEFFMKMGCAPESLNLENFLRHSFQIVLHTDSSICGSLLVSTFKCGSKTTLDHPVIKPFPTFVHEIIKSNSHSNCFIGEYLSVHPEFRKSILGLSLADILVGLYNQLFLELGGAISLAATVRQAKVDEIAKNFGYQELGSYLKIGVDCIMLYNLPAGVRQHPNPEIARWTSHFWNTKTDYTETFEQKKSNLEIKVA